jgi:hypothetical protein
MDFFILEILKEQFLTYVEELATAEAATVHTARKIEDRRIQPILQHKHPWIQ